MQVKSRQRIHKTALVAAILCIYGVASAQVDESNSNNDQKSVELPSIHVVGSIDKAGNSQNLLTQSVSEVTDTDMAEKANTKVDDALSYESGVLTGFNGSDSRTNWMLIRGLKPSYTIDGTAQTEYSYFGFTPETYGLERVEVLKGANSQLYGATEAGGTVNMVTKRPKDVPAGEINTFVGNNHQRGLNFDYSGIASQDKSVRYRLVGQYRDEDGPQHFTGLKHYYIAPSLTWDISGKTSVTFLSSFQRDFGVPTNSFMRPYGTLINTPYGKVNPKTFYGEPGFDHVNRKSSTLGYELSHEFDNGLKFQQNYRYKRQDIDIGGAFVFNNIGTTVSRLAYALDADLTTNSIDNRLSKTFRGQGYEDTVMVGVDYLRTSISGSDFNGTASNVDMFNPVYGTPIATVMKPLNLTANELGLYASNSLLLDHHWLVNLGVRHSKSKNHGHWGSNFANDYSKTTYNAGFAYLADNGLSPYMNYAESFKPVYGVNSNSDVYRPYETKQWEVGVKYEPTWLADSQFTLAYFDATAENSFVPNGTAHAGQALETRSKGVEAQANVKLTNQLNLQVAYTYIDAVTDDSATVSYRTAYVPHNSASAWMTYRFANNALSGLTVGAGARYVGETVDAKYDNKVPDYILWDAMAQYQIDPRWTLQLNMTNLANKKYVAGCNYWCYYGAERSVLATLRYKW